MVSFFNGTNKVIFKFLGVDRKKLNNKSTHILPMKDGESFSLIRELYEVLERNYRQVGAEPKSESGALWRGMPETYIGKENSGPEKILEKAVGMLAESGHMSGWFNQCPVASGITDHSKDRNRAVDLVHLSDQSARLIELKWCSNTPIYALFEILEYGLAYIFYQESIEKN